MPLDALESGLVSPRRFHLTEYHRLIDVGVLGEDERIELLEGVIVEMAPQGRSHALVLSRLNRILTRVLEEALSVRPQLPLSLGEDSEPDAETGRYRTLRTLGMGETLTSQVLPGLTLPVAELFA